MIVYMAMSGIESVICTYIDPEPLFYFDEDE